MKIKKSFFKIFPMFCLIMFMLLLFCFVYSFVKIVSVNKSYSVKNFRAEICHNLPLSKSARKLGSKFSDAFSDGYYEDIYRTNGMLIKTKNPKFSNSDIKESARSFDNIYKNRNFYLAIVPSAASVYSDYLPQSDNSKLLKEKCNNFIGVIQENTRIINLYNVLNSKKENYIYYRTDDMWTSEGAYYAYNSIITAMGLNSVDLSYLQIQHVSGDYEGKLEKISGSPYISPDYIDRYDAVNSGNLVTRVKYSNSIKKISIFDDDYINSSDKLHYYLGDLSCSCKITTNSIENKELLVLGDDYSREIIQFFVNNFKRIDYVNIDSVNDGKKYKISDYDNCLVLFGDDKIGDRKFFDKLEQVFD